MKRNDFIKFIGLGISTVGLTSIFGFKKRIIIRRNKVITFTPEIIRKHNFGLYIINDNADVVNRPDYSATVSWKLTWNLGVAINYVSGKKVRAKEWPKYSKCNFLTDGWVCPLGDSYEEVCEYLNNNPHGEKYRIMTKEELFYMINHRGNQKQLFYEDMEMAGG